MIIPRSWIQRFRKWSMMIPAMIAMGRKGGSTVAAAILNALIYQAAKMQEPEQRGW